MAPRPVEELVTALDRKEWLRIGEVAVLLGVSRQTVHRMLTETPPKIRYKVRPGSGEQRECDPDDVRRLYDERHRVYGDEV